MRWSFRELQHWPQVLKLTVGRATRYHSRLHGFGRQALANRLRAAEALYPHARPGERDTDDILQPKKAVVISYSAELEMNFVIPARRIARFSEGRSHPTDALRVAATIATRPN